MNAITHTNRQATAMRSRLRHWTSALRRRVRRDDGMSTSEYAVGTLAACAFAAILYKVVTSEGVVSALNQLITKALDVQV
ncbi:DUF4244 domain-containing protein [Streptomyces sp. NPDC006632]|uniref:DUF4244 domain-containing protein n=1 Tax=unclassified Streptomyces TaxID=2593676 RepID=UPI002E20374A